MTDARRDRRPRETNRIAWEVSPGLEVGITSLLDSEARIAVYLGSYSIQVLSQNAVELALKNGVYDEPEQVSTLRKYENTLDGYYSRQFPLLPNVDIINASKYVRLGFLLYLPTHRERKSIVNPPFFDNHFTGEVSASVTIPKTETHKNGRVLKDALEAFKATFQGEGRGEEANAVADESLYLTHPIVHLEPIVERPYVRSGESVS